MSPAWPQLSVGKPLLRTGKIPNSSQDHVGRFMISKVQLCSLYEIFLHSCCVNKILFYCLFLSVNACSPRGSPFSVGCTSLGHDADWVSAFITTSPAALCALAPFILQLGGGKSGAERWGWLCSPGTSSAGVWGFSALRRALINTPRLQKETFLGLWRRLE